MLWIQRTNTLHRSIENGERSQSEEIELHQTDGFHVIFVELRDDTAIRPLGIQRTKIRQFSRCNQYTTGMHTNVTCNTLNLLRQRE